MLFGARSIMFHKDWFSCLSFLTDGFPGPAIERVPSLLGTADTQTVPGSRCGHNITTHWKRHCSHYRQDQNHRTGKRCI